MQTISMPELAAGETYIATLFDAASQTGQHIILLDGDNNNATWEEQKSWATSIGGELPTRFEQALLYAKHKDLFQVNWYWSGEQHAVVSGYAWFQYFGDGYQLGINTLTNLRARAVRRLAI